MTDKNDIVSEFIDFIVNEKVKKQVQIVWDLLLLYFTEKNIPYIDFIDFSKDKDRIAKAIEKLSEKTQGEFQDMSDVDDILKNVDDKDEGRNEDNG